MDKETAYAQVILPLKLKWNPWYVVPRGTKTGDRVLVKFSGREYYAVVKEVSDRCGIDEERIFPIIRYNTGLDAISDNQLELWSFISDYYLCPIGDVYKAACPKQIAKDEAYIDKEIASLNIRIDSQRMKASKLRSEIDSRKGRRRVREETTKKLEEKLRVVLSDIEDMVRRQESLTAAAPGQPAGAQQQAAQTKPQPQTQTKPEQTQIPAARKPEVILMAHRAEKYIGLAADCLSAGHSVLIMVPEIYLCENLQQSLSDSFPGKVFSYTSKCSSGERTMIAARVRKTDSPVIVIGTRSSIFLPFVNLGLVIVDEEQDSSYKSDVTPRINARDAAVVLAKIHGANTVLGSSCPSMETLYNCETGKYTLSESYLTAPDNLYCIDMEDEFRKRGVKGYFSIKLLEEIKRTDGKAVLIRGWENQEKLLSEMQELDIRADVMTLHQFRASDCRPELCAILQADAFHGNGSDFRSDEHLMQSVDYISRRCGRLLVQTSKGASGIFKPSEGILQERKAFNLPPFSRLIDIRTRDGRTIRRLTLPKGNLKPNDAAAVQKYADKGYIIDVDPV